VLKKHLHFHPYEVTSVHEFHERDNVKRAEYCRCFRDVITTNGDDALGVTFFTEQAWFHLSGNINSQNSGFWSATSPQQMKDTPLYDLKFGV
jgi:hypothetical protein